MLHISVNDNKTLAISHNDGVWSLNGEKVSVDIRQLPNGIISILYNNKSYTAIVEKIDIKNKELSLRINGSVYSLAVKEPMDQLLQSMGIDLKAAHKLEPLKAPMPGMVLKVMVEQGQKINKGDALLILEAMKMENVLKAGANATVKNIKVTERTAVEKGAVLIELE